MITAKEARKLTDEAKEKFYNDMLVKLVNDIIPDEAKARGTIVCLPEFALRDIELEILRSYGFKAEAYPARNRIEVSW